MALLQEIKSEIIYVLTLWIIITCGLTLVDVQYRWQTQGDQTWEYVAESVDAWAVAATTGGTNDKIRK